MRSTFTRFAIGLVFIGLGLAQTPPDQGPSRTFYLSQPATPQDLTMLDTMIRTVVDLRDISVDQPHGALVSSNGTVDQGMAADWLIHQLDQPQPAATPEYRMAGENGDVIHVFRLAAPATSAELTGMVTGIRTVVDVQRLFPYSRNGHQAVVARGPADKIAAAEWLIQQAILPAGQTIVDSPEYPMAGDRGPEVARVFHLKAGTSNGNLIAMVTVIRTIVDLQRLFPYEPTAALMMRGTSEKVVAAEWLVHELGKLSDTPDATHQTTLPGVTDGVVRVFYLSHHSAPELVKLVTQIRTDSQIQRIFPYELNGQRWAVILRGRPDQMSAVEAMVTKFAADVQ